MIKENYGVPMIPFGLLAGFVENREVRITELAEEGFRFRTAKEIQEPKQIRICFYNMERTGYEELVIHMPEVEKEQDDRFFHSYIVWMDFAQERARYRKLVQQLLGQYSRYIRLKLTEDDGGVAKALTGYPAELDEVHAKNWEEQKQKWFEKSLAAMCTSITKLPELAISLDRPELYKQYQDRLLKDFVKIYWEQQHLQNYVLAGRRPDRLYIGNQFCRRLFPSEEWLFVLLKKAAEESVQVTIAFPCMKEVLLEQTEELLKRLDRWCEECGQELEVVVNDWGLARKVEQTTRHLVPCLGILLNKYKKDPRMQYKQEHQELLRENSLGLKEYREYLQKEFGICRYEWECCGYGQNYPKGQNSLYFPFYQTNTSQYCPVYAFCTTGVRGRQKEPVNCPQYCQNKVFLYPDHMKMVGRYNSLFGFDDRLLREPELLEAVENAGIDRLVVNLL